MAGTALPTMLPTTCGEETDLPGVPRVGCVASVSCRYNSSSSSSSGGGGGGSGGLAASIIATADSVAILGPDLDQWRHGRHCLFTRHLWRPATLCEPAATTATAAAHRAGGGKSSAALSSSPLSPLAAATSAGLLTHADGSGVSIVALTACPLAPPIDSTTTERSTAPAGAVGAAPQESLRRDLEDAVAVVVAWADSALRHHVTVLVVHLQRVLAPSWPGYADGTLVRLVAQDAIALPPSFSVLRLFYHPAMSSAGSPSPASAIAADSPHGAVDGVPSHAAAPMTHVVLCSVYSSAAAMPFGTGSNAMADASGGGIAKKPAPAVMSSTGAERAANSAPPTASTARRRGALLFLSISAALDDANSSEDGAVHAGPSSLSEVAPWLLAFRTDRVVCAFTVQSPTTRVIAAAGTTDGRVFVIGESSQRLVRRVSGPVADAVFVRTRPARAEAAARNAVVDDLLADALREDVMKNGSFNSAAEAELARREESEFVALVVLDSSGHLIVLRAVNSGAPITQTVADPPQIITLANGQKQTLTFVSPSLTNLDEEAQISSRNFLDLSSLRHFIGRRRPPLPPRRTVSTASTGNVVPLASSSLTATPVNSSFSVAGAGSEEPALSGHILSRGLLCVANIDWGKGSSELVVSTMGQVVVSVPFSAAEGCFRIAGFTVTPAPMFYVGFVDFFADGNPTLVMAGLKNVLVASRPQSTLRERAQLLLRLLNKKERERQHVESDDGVIS